MSAQYAVWRLLSVAALLIGLLSPALAQPTGYCVRNLSRSPSISDCQIMRVTIAGTTLHTTQRLCQVVNGSAYSLYPAIDSATTALQAGQVYLLGIRLPFNTYAVAAWLDADQSGTFDSDEYTLVARSAPSRTLNEAPLPVPSTALTGPTRLRIRTAPAIWPHPLFSPTAACERVLDEGETRDYIVTIAPAAPLSPNLTLSAPYCVAPHASGCGAGIITEVHLGDTDLQLPSTCALDGTGNAYTAYPAAGRATARVVVGNAYTLRVRTDVPVGLGAWADWNHNNLLEPTEWLSLTASGTTATATVRVPATALPGPTRLRVRSWPGGFVAAADACTAFGGGETEDYTLIMLPGNQPAPNWQWVRQINAQSLDDYGRSIVTDAAGNLLVAGQFTDTARFGTEPGAAMLKTRGSGDAFVAKYTPDGTLLWAHRLGSFGSELAWAVAADAAGNVYAAGVLNGLATFDNSSQTLSATGGFLVSYAAGGALRWARGLGATPRSLGLDAAGSVYLAGTFTGRATFGSVVLNGTSPSANLFVVKYSSQGVAQWGRQSTGTGSTTGRQLTVSPGGQVMVGGYFYGTANFGSTAFVSGTGANQYSGFLLRYDPAGTLRWARHYYGTGEVQVHAVGARPDGGTYLAGRFTDSASFGGLRIARPRSFGTNMFVAHIDSSGVARWVNEASGNNVSPQVGGIAAGPDGSAYLTATTSGTIYFDTTAAQVTAPSLTQTVLVAKYDPDGTHQWVALGGGGNSDFSSGSTGNAITVDSASHVYVTGAWGAELDLGEHTLWSWFGGADIYVARLGADCGSPRLRVSGGGACGGGGLLTLTASGVPAGATYQWRGPNSFVSTAAAPQLPAIASAAGRYTLTLTAPDGCATFAALTVRVEARPAAPQTVGASRCGPGAVTLTATGAPLDGAYRWYGQAAGGAPISGAAVASFTTPTLSATTTYYVSVLTPGGCEGPRTAVVATVTPGPAPALAATGPTTVCAGQAVLLTATSGGSGATYQFLLNGVPIIGTTGATYAATQPGTYTVQATLGICVGTSAVGISVAVAPLPVAPAGTPTSRCGTGAVTLTAAGAPAGGSYRWYTTPSGGTAISGTTGASYTLPTLITTTTYYVSALTAGGCEGPRTPLTATINAVPAVPIPTGASRCGPGTVTLTAAGGPAGGAYQWYSTATGGTPIGGVTGASFTTSALSATTTYYVAAVGISGCESVTRAAVSATINQLPAAPAPVGATRCGPGTVTLSATGAPVGASYAWYRTAAGGSAIPGTTGASFTTSSLNASATYYVSIIGVGGCEGPRAVVTAMVEPVPVAAIVAGGPSTFCQGGSVTLTATGGASYQWSTGNTTPSITVAASGQYSVTATSPAGCQGTAATVNVSVLPQPTVGLNYPAARYCVGDGQLVAPLPLGAPGGTFTATPAGLTLDAQTGLIDVGASAPGAYTILYALAGPCPASASAILTLDAAPVAGFSYPVTTLCAGASGPVIPTLTGLTTGRFSATPAGLVLDPATGYVTPATSQPGTYVVMRAVAGQGTCPAALATAPLQVEAPPAAPRLMASPDGCGVLLTSSAQTGNQWYRDGTLVPGATAITYRVATAADNGRFTVVSTSAAGCASLISVPQEARVVLAELTEAALEIYPNPLLAGEGELIVGVPCATSPLDLTFFDAIGRLVLAGRAVPDATGAAVARLQLRVLAGGLYLLRVVAPDGRELRRRLLVL